MRNRVNRPFVFNHIAGGKSPTGNLRQLREAGVSLVIYSTPCLFAAQHAIEQAMGELRASDGYLPPPGNGVGVKKCTAVLNENLARRFGSLAEQPMADIHERAKRSNGHAWASRL
jgi:hypothetical protein